MTDPAARDPDRHQWAASELAEDFHDHDVAQLSAMDAEDRRLQLGARAVVAEYVDELWTELKRRGARPADHPELYGAVAAMRDLTQHLAYAVGDAVRPS